MFKRLIGVVLITTGIAAAQEWSVPKNAGEPLNTAVADTHPSISADGLTMVFVADRNRVPNYGGRDLWLTRRPSVDENWGAPQNLGPTINTAAHEENPELSPDGHRLYFASNRVTGWGFDIYVTQRHNKRDDLGWKTPEKVELGVNSFANETSPAFYEDDTTGEVFLYFASDRSGNNDLYVSKLGEDGFFLPAEALTAVNSPGEDNSPAISKDGLELYLNTNRAPSQGMNDIWRSKRASTADPWPAADTLGAPFNTPANEVGPSLSRHANEMWLGISFHPSAVGGTIFYDIFKATRPKADEF